MKKTFWGYEMKRQRRSALANHELGQSEAIVKWNNPKGLYTKLVKGFIPLKGWVGILQLRIVLKQKNGEVSLFSPSSILKRKAPYRGSSIPYNSGLNPSG
ncbi:MAG: hypothetical protein HC905_10105 [Bacteroidales bacterium]|nr:hypothetical protein [Bacteroidales bacterium]